MKNDKNKNIEKESTKDTIYPAASNYPAKDDIYNQNKEEEDLDPENTSKKKSPNEKLDEANEKDFGDLVTGADLDVPGSELDDAQEDIGTEDEENNYYSLGGDNHTNLDENNSK
ncbi:hypothetical protein BH10BAC1_BH10BAC1_03730 [soil metagenome]